MKLVHIKLISILLTHFPWCMFKKYKFGYDRFFNYGISCQKIYHYDRFFNHDILC